MTVQRHFLKTWRVPFRALRAGEKPFEVRRNDRDFRIGDVLVLQEWDEQRGAHTGDEEIRRVAWIQDGGQFGVAAGFVVMALAPMAAMEAEDASTPASLARWHALAAQKAWAIAGNWRVSAERRDTPQLTAARYRRLAAAGDDEGDFHEAAARLINELAGRAGRTAA